MNDENDNTEGIAMIDDVLEGFSKGLGWFFGQVVGSVLFRVGYLIGWPFVKCLTLGNYPRKRRFSYRKKYDMEGEVWTSCLGLLIAIGTVIYFLAW